MKKFTVTVPEIHHSYMVVEADSAEEARSKVALGEGTEEECSYAGTPNPNEVYEFGEWDVKSLD